VYEAYDSPAMYPTIKKTLQIDYSGIVTYEDSKIGQLSSFLYAFSTPITSFASTSIGGANIVDSSQPDSDTIVNALGKLDAWITNAFLLQPPAVKIIEQENNSLYAGVRWVNFPTYSILDKFVPYVTSILFIVGDPGTPNYCTFEMFDTNYFPYKTFIDGISPNFTPLVRFRVFTDFFLTKADHLYTKKAMQAQCFRIVTESGTATFPTTGKVLALENTNGEDTYTTLSIYLPNIKDSYPKDTEIPIKVVYLNRTIPSPNVSYMSSIINTFGAPSAPLYISQDQVTNKDNYIGIEVHKPIYSDQIAQISTPFFSSYRAYYTLQSMLPAYISLDETIVTGFRYGIPDINTIPNFAIPYSNVTFSQDLPYCSSLQTILVTGGSNPVYPGMQWSTSVAAINSAYLVGDQTNDYFRLLYGTSFPITTTPKISSLTLSNTSYTQTRYACASTMNVPQYTGDGWSTCYYISTDVVFLSTTMNLEYQLSCPCQFNDTTYPGDRSTITVDTYYTDIYNVQTNSLTFAISSFQDDFPLNLWISTIADTNTMSSVITDSKTSLPEQKFFYDLQIRGTQTIDTISMIAEQLQVSLTNDAIDSTIGGYSQTNSSITYFFQTEPVHATSTTGIVFQNIVTGAQQVSGIFTPTTSSLFYFDMLGSNIGKNVVSSCFATAYLSKNGYLIGPQSNYNSNVYIYDGTDEVTSLPLPVDITLNLSACTLRLNSNVYQIHDDPKHVYIVAKFQPAAPQTQPNTFYSSLTSTIFIDTVSMNTVSTFDKTTGPNGLRVVSLLPRDDYPVTPDNIEDGVDELGNAGQGLNVTTSGHFAVGYDNVFSIDPSVIYDHTRTLSSIYTDYYSRELLYTNGSYIHSAGFNFSQFNPALIGQPDGVYPDYTYDLVYDENFGYRYASFAYESVVYPEPTPIRYVYVTIKNPSLVSTIQDVRANNTCFPADLVPAYFISSMKVRMHVKALGVYNAGVELLSESSWVNGFTAVDEITFNDEIFDIPACHGASTIGSDIQYKVQINRRLYTKLCPIVRIGISQDGSAYSGEPITFDAVHISLSDI